MKVTISRSAQRQILAHCGEMPDIEACGLLFGDVTHIETAQIAENVAQMPDCRFEIDPQILFDAIRAERNGGDRLIGHYHSHPTGAAEPSAEDAVMALDPGTFWLIVAGDEMQLWRVSEPGKFEPVELSLASQTGKGH